MAELDVVLIFVTTLIIYFVAWLLSKRYPTVKGSLSKWVRFELPKNDRDGLKMALFAVLPVLVWIIVLKVLIPVFPSDQLSDSSLFNILFSGLLAPFGEELLWRGLFFVYFEIVFIALSWKFKFFKGKFIEKHISFFILFNAFTFMLMHDFRVDDFIRFVSGLIYVGLYVAYDRNLLPSFIAHYTNNLTLIFLIMNN